MTQDERNRLSEERANIMSFINRASERVRDIDERLRLLDDGKDKPDFSGAVERMKKKGLL